MMVRKLDELGRIVVPKEMRRTLAINEGDGIAIYMNGDSIVLSKHSAACFVCDSREKVQRLNKGYFCEECYDKLTLVEVN